MFDTDTTATGYSVMNIIHLSLNPTVHFGVATMVDDAMNGNVALFYETIQQVESYSFEKNELKFFYNGEQNYLLYKFQQ
jgi:hypothetical protein